MGDKCQAHDQCLGKIQDGIDSIRDDLRDGRVNFATHEMRISRLEQTMGGWNWRGNLSRLLIGLLEKGIILLIGMAYWAHLNGYGG